MCQYLLCISQVAVIVARYSVTSIFLNPHWIKLRRVLTASPSGDPFMFYSPLLETIHPLRLSNHWPPLKFYLRFWFSQPCLLSAFIIFEGRGRVTVYWASCRTLFHPFNRKWTTPFNEVNWRGKKGERNKEETYIIYTLIINLV